MKNLQELLKGYVVVDVKGNHWVTSDIDDVSKYVWAGTNARRVDWPITDPCINQDVLTIPGESNDEHLSLCRWSLNENCDTPYEAEDFCLNDRGDFIYNF